MNIIKGKGVQTHIFPLQMVDSHFLYNPCKISLLRGTENINFLLIGTMSACVCIMHQPDVIGRQNAGVLNIQHPSGYKQNIWFLDTVTSFTPFLGLLCGHENETLLWAIQSIFNHFRYHILTEILPRNRHSIAYQCNILRNQQSLHTKVLQPGPRAFLDFSLFCLICRVNTCIDLCHVDWYTIYIFPSCCEFLGRLKSNLIEI